MKKIIKYAFFGFIGLLLVAGLFNAFTGNSIPVLDIKKEKEDKLRDMVFESETKIQNNLKDPQSFELVNRDWRFLNDSVYEINIIYSATNSFGGRIQNKYIKTGILTFDKKDSTFINEIKFQNFKLD